MRIVRRVRTRPQKKDAELLSLSLSMLLIPSDLLYSNNTGQNTKKKKKRHKKKKKKKETKKWPL